MRRNFGHDVENTGNVLISIEMFQNDRYEEVSLVNCLTPVRPLLIARRLNIAKEVLDPQRGSWARSDALASSIHA